MQTQEAVKYVELIRHKCRDLSVEGVGEKKNAWWKENEVTAVVTYSLNLFPLTALQHHQRHDRKRRRDGSVKSGQRVTFYTHIKNLISLLFLSNKG